MEKPVHHHGFTIRGILARRPGAGLFEVVEGICLSMQSIVTISIDTLVRVVILSRLFSPAVKFTIGNTGISESIWLYQKQRCHTLVGCQHGC